MCGIIGFWADKLDDNKFELLRNLFLETKIRGLHATGMSIVQYYLIKTFIEKFPADKFVDLYLQNLNLVTDIDSSVKLIGHCRYSTSDLEYNQPITKINKSIVHNGVISQEPQKNWESIYGVKTETKNDSELLHFSDNPLSYFSNSSIAACELNPDCLRFFRNGKRPLYFVKENDLLVVSSTKDILRRCGLNSVQSAEINTVYELNFDDKSLSQKKISVNNEKEYQLND